MTCRECGERIPGVARTYLVVRDDGTYPGTHLCPECLDDYRHDPDVRSVEEER